MKTKFLIVDSQGGTDHAILTIDNINIERVSSIKYLGVILDDKLKFDKHFEYITKKIAKKVGFLKRIRNNLDLKTTRLVYNSIVTPHLNYCSSVLFLCNEAQNNKLQVIQNRGMRMILKCNIFTRVKIMLQNLNMMTTKQHIIYNTLTMIYKLKNNMLPKYLQTNIMYHENVHNYPTRSCRDFRLPKTKLTCTQNSVFYKGQKLYNNLPNAIKEASSLDTFRKTCAIYIKQNV